MTKSLPARSKILNVFRGVFLLRTLEKILVNCTIGKEFGTFITKFPPNHYQYPLKSIRKVNRGGINYNLDISDMIDWFIYYGFKEKEKNRIFRNIRQGDIFLDIGANIGEISMNAAQIVSGEGKVIAFEPDPFNVSRFIHNLKLNNFSNIELVNKGAGNKSGVFLMKVLDDRNRGMNKIVNNDNESDLLSKIEVITIDDYVSEKGLKKIDMIKIDAEGYEMKILKGAEQIITEFTPILFIEVDDDNLKQQNSSAREMVAFLENKNYSIEDAENELKVNSSSNLENCHIDIICKNKSVPK